MLRYALTRLVSLALSLVVASLVIFVALEVVPGDPAGYMLGLNATPETVAALRAELGLDAGPVERYLGWVGGMLRGDFGISYTYRTPVAGMVGDRLQVSLPLALYALALSTAIAFPVGIWAAARRGTAVDAGVMGATQLGVAVPNFWFAMLLVLVFAVNLRWFSAGGFPGWDAGLWRGAEGADPAGDRAGAAAGLDPRAGHALGADRHAGRGLHPHRPRQGPDPRAGAAAACAAERADPGADHHRAAVLLPARRRDHHRERVLPARPRAAGVPGDQPARPDRGRERGDAAGLRGDRSSPSSSTSPMPRSIRGCGGGADARAGRSAARWSRVFVAGGARLLRLDALRRRRARHRGEAPGRRRPRTGSAPTISAATCSR